MMSIDFYNFYTYGGPSEHADNFSVYLFVLIRKAHPTMRRRLAEIFPLHVKLWEKFMNDENHVPPFHVTPQYVEEKMKEWGMPDA